MVFFFNFICSHITFQTMCHVEHAVSLAKISQMSVNLSPSLLSFVNGVRLKPNGTEKDVLPNNSSLRQHHLSFPHIINITATALNMMAAIWKAQTRVGLEGSCAHFITVDSCFPVTVPCARGPFPSV